MQDLSSERGIVRIGVVFLLMTVMGLGLAMIGPGGPEPLPWLAFGGLGVIGVGLLRRARFARVLAGLLLLAGAVATLGSFAHTLAVRVSDGVDVAWLLPASNAAATTLLLGWLFVRGLLILGGRAGRAAAVTPRVVGIALACIAAGHLWLAYQLGFDSELSWSARITPEQTAVYGFALWPFWHLALLIVAVALAAAPRRMLRHAAAALVLLLAALLALLVVKAASMSVLTLLAPALGALLAPVYLSWWLRDELVRSEVS